MKIKKGDVIKLSKKITNSKVFFMVIEVNFTGDSVNAVLLFDSENVNFCGDIINELIITDRIVKTSLNEVYSNIRRPEKK